MMSGKTVIENNPLFLRMKYNRLKMNWMIFRNNLCNKIKVMKVVKSKKVGWKSKKEEGKRSI